MCSKEEIILIRIDYTPKMAAQVGIATPYIIIKVQDMPIEGLYSI